MSRIPALVIALSAIAMAGSASAQSRFQAAFYLNPNLSAEENYASFEKIARKACSVNIKEAGGILNKARQERPCISRLLADAVKATNDLGISRVHALQNGAPPTVVASRH